MRGATETAPLRSCGGRRGAEPRRRTDNGARRTLLRTALTRDQAGRPMKLSYYLLAQWTAGMEQYGAEIVLERGGVLERCAVAQITPLARSMVNIIAILAEGTVTPATMREVLEDIL